MRELIIIGPPRCGTTSAFRWLTSHPTISPSQRKELNYFTGFSLTHDRFDPVSQIPYQAFFQHKAGARWTLEASPLYSHPQLVPFIYGRIRETLPDAWIMVMLRDPVDRFVSHYNVEKREGMAGTKTLADYVRLANQFDSRPPERESFAENVWLQVADYPRILHHVLRYFPSDRVIPVFMDWFRSDPEHCAKYLTEALELEEPLDPHAIQTENAYYRPRNLSLHKLASAVRRYAEPMLQRNPVLRQKLYCAYRGLNIGRAGGRTKEENSADGLMELRTYYASRNADLRTLLTDKFGLGRVPPWLDG